MILHAVNLSDMHLICLVSWIQFFGLQLAISWVIGRCSLIIFLLKMFLFELESYIPIKHSYWWRGLEDVFCRRLQDVFKTNIFTLALRLQKTSLRHLQDVLVKTNIFVLAIRLQDLFKTFPRLFQDCSC